MIGTQKVYCKTLLIGNVLVWGLVCTRNPPSHFIVSVNSLCSKRSVLSPLDRHPNPSFSILLGAIYTKREPVSDHSKAPIQVMA